MERVVTKAVPRNILIVGNVFLGFSYLIAQWIYKKTIIDSIFIGLLLSSTIFLILNTKRIAGYFRLNGLQFYLKLYGRKNFDLIERKFQKDSKNILDNYLSVIFGFIFSSGYMVYLIYMNYWNDHIVIKAIFLAYLFFVSFFVGIAIFSLIQLLTMMYQWCSDVQVEIWEVNNESVLFIRNLRNKILTTISIYTSVTIGSVLTGSVIQKNWMLLAFTIFALALNVLVYILPELIIYRKFSEVKEKFIQDVNEQINFECKLALENAKTNNDALNIEKIESLFSLREKAIAAGSQQFEINKIISFTSYIIITIAPMILQKILEKIF